MATDGSDGNDSADAEKARMQSLYREVNERVRDVNDQRASPDLPSTSSASARSPSARN
jgi:hypothetical protein